MKANLPTKDEKHNESLYSAYRDTTISDLHDDKKPVIANPPLLMSLAFTNRRFPVSYLATVGCEGIDLSKPINYP